MVVVQATVTLAQETSVEEAEDGCGECDSTLCDFPKNCPAGIVKDECNCCMVCGKQEFELCAHEDVPSEVFLGHCGENLECRVRDDQEEGEEPEALCMCNIEGMLCGSNGVTYDNMCQLLAANSMLEEGATAIDIQTKGPCPTAPSIMNPPENVKDESGNNIAIVCEARGFPIPAIEWTWTRVDGKTEYLPSDDTRISANMRGGPEKMQVTGWLQIMDVQKDHEGDYTCIAQNKLGMAEATSRLNVVTDSEAEKKRKRRKNRRRKNKADRE